MQQLIGELLVFYKRVMHNKDKLVRKRGTVASKHKHRAKTNIVPQGGRVAATGKSPLVKEVIFCYSL